VNALEAPTTSESGSRKSAQPDVSQLPPKQRDDDDAEQEDEEEETADSGDEATAGQQPAVFAAPRDTLYDRDLLITR